ncbi:NlpC/P60 family protein [Myceligenerans pegani]|uniref:C40 family peptidase n=1 Tax=Myceligenerans pegani TaxID=2776917 RepID=A0ABR9MUU3_9MICO|nr:NlpC/P60 family protein [Myceligenerans sp. TRM 65318]MBE1875149.1 C40 family peptidase [Myceligenerans sp. TRM 65318]MBE3017420.1 C40 family peptidase [Myceligenerans sp. TRM 65318]
MSTKPGAIRDAVVWWVRGSGRRVRVGPVGWRVLAVLVLVIALVYPWGPVATADDVAPPAGPTEREAVEARDAVRAGELDVAQAEAALAGLRQELEDARIRVQSAAADHEDAVAALDAAEAEVRQAREAAERAGNAEAKARAGLAAVYRAAQRSGGATDALGPLEVVLEAEDVDDLIGQDAAERAVRRKLAAALAQYSDARAVSESADARWSAARQARAAAKAQAEAAYEAAQRAVVDLAERTEAAERDRTLLVERLADLRNTSIRIEREREEARAAAALAEREAAARAALEAAQAEAGAAGGLPEGGEDAGGDRAAGGAPGSEPDPGSGSASDPGPGGGIAPEPEPGPPAPEPPAPGPSGSWSGTAAQGEAAVAWARTKIGSPYELGAEGPTSYDCSGLTSEAWEFAGRWITRTSRSQYLAVAKIGYEELRPGDLIFYGSDPADPQSIYHVAMYSGDGRMIEAVMPGVSLRETDLRLSGAMPWAGRP